MRKQELIHLHGLAALVRTHLEETTDVPPEAFQAYDEAAVGPTAIHRHKRAHRHAVRLALDGAISVIEEEPTRAVPVESPPTQDP